MAKKLGRLAGLAALAGAAYMMREKFGKDKDARGPAATAAEKNCLKTEQTRKKRPCLALNQLKSLVQHTTL
jgi:uncharacterized membrane protein YebE (DUF533 family)